MRALPILLLFVAGAAHAAPARLTDAEVRSYLSRQEQAWNAGRLDAWAALYTPDARFTDQARSNKNDIVSYGTSSLREAKAQSKRFRAKSKVRETGEVVRLQIAPDGRSASVVSRKVSRIEAAGRVRLSCADSAQTVVLQSGRILSRGQTDTLYRCPR